MMNLTIKFGPHIESHKISVTVPDDCAVDDLIKEVWKNLPLVAQTSLNSGERNGSTVFLSRSPTGPERILPSQRLNQHNLSDGSILF